MSFEKKCSNIIVMKSQQANNVSLFHNSGISCLQFRAAYVGALYNNIFMDNKCNLIDKISKWWNAESGTY